METTDDQRHHALRHRTRHRAPNGGHERDVSPPSAGHARVSVVVPALNEARNLQHAFASLPADIHEVVLVDGRSTDQTVRVARQLRPDIRVVVQRSPGKGAALAAGFAACTGDIIVSMDADGSTNAAEIPRFVHELLDGADYVKGSRYLRGGGSADLTRVRSLGNRSLGTLVNLLHGTRYTDLCYGYNAFWSRCLPWVLPDRDGFEVETLMNIRAAKTGLVVREVPSYEERRIYGHSKLNAFSDGWRVVATILAETRPRHPTPAPITRTPQPITRTPHRRENVPQRPHEHAAGRRPDPAPTQDVSVDVSVVICAFTEERWNSILRAVDSVRDQKTAAHEIILVVDHNPQLHERLRAELPDLVVVENAHANGLSGGKNTGIAAAGGSVVAFLDDDAVAEPDWLTHLAGGYADPRVLAVGGATYPSWHGRGRPAWFPHEFDWVVGCSYRGLPASTTPVRNPFGGNSSFRRWVFTTIGGFTPGIGRSGGKRPLGCEETELSIRLHRRHPDAVVLYEPRAVIWHDVPPTRATWRYFRARCYAEGLSKADVTRRVGAADGLASERAHTLRTLPAGAARGLLEALAGQPAGLARSCAIVAGLAAATAGYAAGKGRQRLGRRPQPLPPASIIPAPNLRAGRR